VYVPATTHQKDRRVKNWRTSAANNHWNLRVLDTEPASDISSGLLPAVSLAGDLLSALNSLQLSLKPIK
jgi:hypothetical protein